jgi:hypothetical protein
VDRPGLCNTEGRPGAKTVRRKALAV